MEWYAPTARDLASCNMVSWLMNMKIQEECGCGSENDHVHLQLSHLPWELIYEQLPGIAETTSIFSGIDIIKKPIPVIPMVHYCMRGVSMNYKGQVLSSASSDSEEQIMPGLYVAGEIASVSVHGANQLGANSLLNIVVFGRACASHIADNNEAGMPLHTKPSPDSRSKLILEMECVWTVDGNILLAQLCMDMQKAMQSNAAVFWTEDSLWDGVSKIKKVQEHYTTCLVIKDWSLIWNLDLVESLELQNLLTCAAQMVKGAITWKESQGSHAQEDFSERDHASWMKHTLTWQESDTQPVNLGHQPVIMTTLDDKECAMVMPKRSY